MAMLRFGWIKHGERSEFLNRQSQRYKINSAEQGPMLPN
jgi:hypothetical protein